MAVFALVHSRPAAAAVIASYDFNTGTEGWGLLTVTGLTTSGGFLTGTASNNDPQLLKNPESISVGAGQTWDTVVFRVREFDDVSGKYIGSAGAPAFNTIGLIVQVNGTIINSGFTAVDSGDDFHTITANISGLADTTITNFAWTRSAAHSATADRKPTATALRWTSSRSTRSLSPLQRCSAASGCSCSCDAGADLRGKIRIAGRPAFCCPGKDGIY